MPTLTEMMFNKSKERDTKMKGVMYQTLTNTYGKTDHYESQDLGFMLDNGEGYHEWDTKGELIRRMEDKVPRSRYQEDQYINDHTSVWGSWWNPN